MSDVIWVQRYRARIKENLLDYKKRFRKIGGKLYVTESVAARVAKSDDDAKTILSALLNSNEAYWRSTSSRTIKAVVRDAMNQLSIKTKTKYHPASEAEMAEYEEADFAFRKALLQYRLSEAKNARRMVEKALQHCSAIRTKANKDAIAYVARIANLGIKINNLEGDLENFLKEAPTKAKPTRAPKK